MSDKDRQKKDGGRKDKKNKAMRERENTREQRAETPQKSRDVSNFTDTEPGAASVKEQS